MITTIINKQINKTDKTIDENIVWKYTTLFSFQIKSNGESTKAS